MVTFWFAVVVLAWVLFFVLEGFDFGVGLLGPLLGRDDHERGAALRTIGPFWDGNEVWLVAAIGATFAAFPAWYAALLSGLYLPMAALLLLLAVRGVALEFRGKGDGERWRRRCDLALAVSSGLIVLLWGALLAVFVRGLALGPDASVTGAGLGRSLAPLLTPAAGLGASAALFAAALLGATFLSLRTSGPLRRRARTLARWLGTGGAAAAGGGRDRRRVPGGARGRGADAGDRSAGPLGPGGARFRDHRSGRGAGRGGRVHRPRHGDPAQHAGPGLVVDDVRRGRDPAHPAPADPGRRGHPARGARLPGLLVLRLPPPGGQRAGAVVTRGPIDRRLLRHARAGRAGVAVLALLGAGQAVATLVVAVALTVVVAGGHAWGIGLLLLAYGCRAALAWSEQTVARTTAARVTDELRHAMLRALPRRGPAWVAQFGAGRLTAVLTGGLDALRPWFAGYLPSLVLGVLLPPLVVVAIAVVDPASGLIALLTLPLIPLLGALIGWATQARARQRRQADARLAGHFLDVVRGLPTLRMFGRAARQTEVVADLTDKHRAATVRVLRVAFLSSTALDLVGTLSVGLIAVEAGLRVAAGHLPLGPALLVILLAPEAYRPLREMAARYHAATDATAAIADVDEILTPQPAAAPTRGPRFSPAGVVAAGLGARYPGATTDALALPSLTVAAGEIVALRGPSGAGKTTALRVLAGLHPAAVGSYTVENPLYLPQRPTLPHARTVADLFGPGSADIRAALAATGLDGELTESTQLGEHGAGVSAGQRQRVALAALLHRARRAPATLLLDEPTAHLDPGAERLVIARLREAAEAGCAVLVVAHRPALLAAADRIVDLAPPILRDPSPEVVAGDHRPEEVATEPARRWRRPWVAVALGSGSSLAGLLLTGAAAWLLVRAASLPPVLSLSAAVVLVRGSAVARPLLRYLERLVAHDVAFARLGARRARVYAALIPRVPGPRLRRRGDLLTRVVDDVDARVDGLLRGRLPALAAAVTLGIASVAAVWVAPNVALPLGIGLLVAGVLAPVVASRQAGREDAATASARARLRDAMVETVDRHRGATRHRSPGTPQQRPRSSGGPSRPRGRTSRRPRSPGLGHRGGRDRLCAPAHVRPGPGVDGGRAARRGDARRARPRPAGRRNCPPPRHRRRRAPGHADDRATLRHVPAAGERAGNTRRGHLGVWAQRGLGRRPGTGAARARPRTAGRRAGGDHRPVRVGQVDAGRGARPPARPAVRHDHG